MIAQYISYVYRSIINLFIYAKTLDAMSINNITARQQGTRMALTQEWANFSTRGPHGTSVSL